MRSKLLVLSSLFLLLASCTPTYIVTFSGSTGGSVSNMGGEYDEGTTVSVSAQPETGYEFVGWSDGSSQNPRTISVSENLNLTALFGKQQFSVSINTQGEGTVATSGATGQGSFEYGSSARFEAVPAAGWYFDSWTGNASGNNNPLTISIDGPKSITAVFKRKKFDLTVTVEGEGTVTEQVIVQPGQYDYETQVKLTAVPEEGWEFANWSGDIGSTENPVTVTINTAKNIIATFEKLEIISIEILNPIDSLVISRVHKFQVEGTYSNGNKVDLSDGVELLTAYRAILDYDSLEPPILTALDNNQFTGRKSGLVALDIRFQNLQISTEFAVVPFEYMPIGDDLISSGECQLRVPIVIINYFPTTDGVMHNEEVGPSGFWNLNNPTVEQSRRKVHSDLVLTKNLVEYGSRFRDYGSDTIDPYICLEVVKYVNLYEVGPYKKLRPELEASDLDYKSIFEQLGIEQSVNEDGVKEIWITIFPKSPEYPTVLNNNISNDPNTFYNIAETNMSSPVSGDISNSFRINDDLPIYDNTYVVYGYNAHRGPDTNVHNRGHQVEAQLMWLEQRKSYTQGNELFWNKFVGIDPNSNKPIGRSGMTHFPPNTDVDYDYCNMTLFESDIMNWTPNGGEKTEVNCETWRNINYPFSFNSYGFYEPQSYEYDAHSKWLLFWFQSIPGYQNNIPYEKDGVEYTLTNWWDLIYNWDEAVTQGKTLWE